MAFTNKGVFGLAFLSTYKLKVKIHELETPNFWLLVLFGGNLSTFYVIQAFQKLKKNP